MRRRRQAEMYNPDLGVTRPRTVGSSFFTSAPHHRDRRTVDNERAKEERKRRYGLAEPESLVALRAMEQTDEVLAVQELERSVWEMGREKRKLEGAAFVQRLAKSSAAHKAKVAGGVAGRSRRAARKSKEEAMFEEGEEAFQRDRDLLEEELEKLDDTVWAQKMQSGRRRSGGPASRKDRGAHSTRWHQERLQRQQIRDERSEDALRLPGDQTALAGGIFPRERAWEEPHPAAVTQAMREERRPGHAWTAVLGSEARCAAIIQQKTRASFSPTAHVWFSPQMGRLRAERASGGALAAVRHRGGAAPGSAAHGDPQDAAGGGGGAGVAGAAAGGAGEDWGVWGWGAGLARAARRVLVRAVPAWRRFRVKKSSIEPCAGRVCILLCIVLNN